jgi:hypothetical protein
VKLETEIRNRKSEEKRDSHFADSVRNDGGGGRSKSLIVGGESEKVKRCRPEGTALQEERRKAKRREISSPTWTVRHGAEVDRNLKAESRIGKARKRKHAGTPGKDNRDASIRSG